MTTRFLRPSICLGILTIVGWLGLGEASSQGGRGGRGGRGGAPAAPPSYTNWSEYGGSASSNQYTPLGIVDKSNVGGLEVAWTYPTGGTSTFSPLVIDGIMYTVVQGGVVALNAETGQEMWINPDFSAGARGFNYWENADRSDRRLMFLSDGMLTALDAATGELITSFGMDGQVDVRIGADRDISFLRGQTSNPGRIYDDIFIIPLPASGANYDSAPADVHAFNVVTGELEWVFHTIPRPGEFGEDTWPAEFLASAGGVHNWSEMTVDEERGIAFIPTGRPDTTSTAETGMGTTCSRTAFWRSTPVPASGSGIIRSSITTCGITTCRRRPS
jgi:glucose dehydrogenase